MGKATLARQRAIGTIGLARVQKLDDAGLAILDMVEHERLKARVAELERANRLLMDIANDTTRTNVIAAQVLKEAMSQR